jgi:hypothetical protein
MSSQLLKTGFVLSYSYPIIMTGSFYLTWLVAWAVLGYPPRSIVDDPKYISLIVDIPYYFTGILLLAFPAAILAGLGITPSYFYTYFQAKRQTIIATIVAWLFLGVLWLTTFLFLRSNFLQVITWYVD